MRTLGGVSNHQELVALLKTLSDEDLKLVAAGIDPEAGKVPPEFQAAAAAELSNRRSHARAASSKMFYVGGAALVLLGAWWLSKRGKK